MRPRLIEYLALALLALAGCGGSPERSTVIAQAYAGPAALKLRQEIPLSSATVATVKHGDRVDIVQRRRRFLKVRTAEGVEGWTEENALLSEAEMSALRDLTERARQMLSHGTATTFDVLNVHTLPARRSPSFIQLQNGEKVEVLTYLMAPRIAPPREPLIPATPKKTAVDKKKKEPAIPPVPKPKPPGPPPNWLDLSKTELPPEPETEPEPVPVAMDDWALVRLKTGQAGWVLTRRLFMAIPDEVAQYAEGHRITSYFSLGEVRDESGAVKHNWLWTTLAGGSQGFDFDSFRVFIWNLKRHRYETAYIERKLRGYFPVKMETVDISSGSRGAPAAKFPGFSVCVEKEDGQRHRRNFAFVVNVVRYAGESACEAPPPVPAGGTPDTAAPNNAPKPEAAPAPPSPSLYARIKQFARRWFR